MCVCECESVCVDVKKCVCVCVRLVSRDLWGSNVLKKEKGATVHTHKTRHACAKRKDEQTTKICTSFTKVVSMYPTLGELTKSNWRQSCRWCFGERGRLRGITVNQPYIDRSMGPHTQRSYILSHQSHHRSIHPSVGSSPQFPFSLCMIACLGLG